MKNDAEFSVAGKRFVLIGPDRYKQLGNNMTKKKLRIASGSEIAEALYSIYASKKLNKGNSFLQEDVMKKSWINVYNRNIWTPKNVKNSGVYVQFDADFEEDLRMPSIVELDQALVGGKMIKGVKFSKDGKTAFAPYKTFKLGVQSTKSLSKDGFVIANYGVKGAENLSKVAGKLSLRPYNWILINNSKKPIQTFSSLYIDTNYDGASLVVMGYSQSKKPQDNFKGYAFGVK